MKYVATKRPKLDVGKPDAWTWLTEDGHFTNGRYSVIPIAKDILPKEMYEKEKIMAVSKLIEDLPYVEITEFSYILQIPPSRFTKKYIDVLVYEGVMADGENGKIVLNREYVDVVLSRYPEARIKVCDDCHVVAFYDNDDDLLVGAVLPMLYYV